MRQNLLFTIGVVALLGAGAVVSMQDPPKPVPVNWVTVAFTNANCDEGTYDVTWETDYSSGLGGYVVTGVRISDLTSVCLTQDITVYLNESGDPEATGGTVVAYATVDGDPDVTSGQTSVFFDFDDAHVLVSRINGIAAFRSDPTFVYPTILTVASRTPTNTIVYGQSVVVYTTVMPDASAGSADPRGRVDFAYCYGADVAPECKRNAAERTVFTAGVTLSIDTPNDRTSSATSGLLTPARTGLYRINAVYLPASEEKNYLDSESSQGTTQYVLQVDRAPTSASTPTASWSTQPASNPVYGQAVTFSASVSDGIDPALGISRRTGWVSFRNQNGTEFARCELTGGACTASTNSLFVLTHYIRAVYEGDGNFRESTSGTRTVVVGRASTTTTLSAPASADFGAPVTLTASAVPNAPGGGTPVGSVSFRDAADPSTTTTTLLGSCSLSSGTCSIVARSLAVGTHHVYAVLATSTNYLGSTSAPRQAIEIGSGAAAVTVASSNATPFYRQSFVLTGTARTPAGSALSGTISFSDGTTGGAWLGTCTLVSGSCTVIVSVASVGALATGLHSISGYYEPAGASAGSAIATRSPAASVTILPSPTTTTVTASTTTPVSGQPIALTGAISSVYGGTPAGSVRFVDGLTILGTCSLAVGTTTCTLADVALTDVATHPVVGQFLPSAGGDYSTSSGSISIGVRKAPTAATWTSSVAPVPYGSSATLTAIVTVTAPGTGVPDATSVTFFDGTATIGTCALVATANPNEAACSRSYTPTATGSRTIKVSFPGTARFVSSVFSTTLTVAKVAPTVDLTARTSTGTALTSGQVITLGTTVVYTVTVRAGTAPTGTVYFRTPTSSLASATLRAATSTSSTATYTVRYTSASTRDVYASYGGSTYYLAASSPTFRLVVR